MKEVVLLVHMVRSVGGVKSLHSQQSWLPLTIGTCTLE